jgi:hypothetical protein
VIGESAIRRIAVPARRRSRPSSQFRFTKLHEPDSVDECVLSGEPSSCWQLLALVLTGTASYYSVAGGELTPTLVEQGHRRAHSKWVAGAFTSKFVPACSGCDFGRHQLETSVMLYDRYRN